jgi:hypothetical protein
MAETPSSSTESPEVNLERNLSNLEAREGASLPRGVEGFKSFVGNGLEFLGRGTVVLLALATAAVFKITEYGLRFMQGIIKNPEKPEKWLDPVKENFKKESNKAKK